MLLLLLLSHFSCVGLLATPWTAAYRAPPSMGLSRQEYWSGVPLPSPCVRLCDPMNRSTPGLPVHHQLPEFTETHVHRVSDAIQPSHLLSSPSAPAPNPSQHQSLSQWVNNSYEVAKVLEFQLQHQSFQWTPRVSLLTILYIIFGTPFSQDLWLIVGWHKGRKIWLKMKIKISP